MAIEKPQGATHSHVRTITLAEVKKLLEREQGGREDLSYEQKLALEHATLFAKMEPTRAQDLADKLLKLNGRVNEYYAYRLADLMPSHPDDVKAIFAKDRSVPDDAEIGRILDVVKEFQ